MDLFRSQESLQPGSARGLPLAEQEARFRLSQQIQWLTPSNLAARPCAALGKVLFRPALGTRAVERRGRVGRWGWAGSGAKGDGFGALAVHVFEQIRAEATHAPRDGLSPRVCDDHLGVLPRRQESCHRVGKPRAGNQLVDVLQGVPQGTGQRIGEAITDAPWCARIAAPSGSNSGTRRRAPRRARSRRHGQRRGRRTRLDPTRRDAAGCCA